MNYKRILKKEETRFKILRLFNWVPDRLMIILQYYIKTGRKLDLKNPQRYSEKLQIYKLCYRHPLMTQCADKFEVRDYIKKKGFPHILNTLYGVWDNVEELDFKSLPKTFILKSTNGSGTNIIIKNKDAINASEIKKVLRRWLNRSHISPGREWAYYNIQPRIIAESVLPLGKGDGIEDYKFLCMNGIVEYIFTGRERYSNGGIKVGIYNKKLEKVAAYRKGFSRDVTTISFPRNINEMIKIAESLSKPFPQVRVDLYNIDGRIYFGEMTFYDCSGYDGFVPDSFDFTLGNKFELKSCIG